jgi:predicted nucleotidyltransferase
MSISRPLEAPQLPARVKQVLDDFLQAAKDSFGDQLRSVVLYGSAAEDKLRATSDVNLVLVLSSFEQNKIDPLRQPLRVAQAAIQLRPMFLLSEEIPAATRFFAPKFADILRRRVILHGEDPFAAISIPREAEIRQLKQQLLNFTLRLRAAYVAHSLREEQLTLVAANAAGPLRSYAASLLGLEGHPAGSPQQAFERLGTELAVPDWNAALSAIAAAQEAQLNTPGAAAHLFFQLLDFVGRMHTRVEALSGEVRRESI